MEDRITEQDSPYDNLQQMSVHDILTGINREDARVHEAVAKTIPVMERLVERVVERMERGGRMFYIGAGTSGRLGVTDASELPPTYGVPFDRVIGLIAGGDGALRRAVENAEDDTAGAWARHGALPSHGGRCPGRDRRVGYHSLCGRRPAHGAGARPVDRLHYLQSVVARGG